MSRQRPARQEVRRDLAVLALLSCLVILPGLGARDLWNPNEPIYGQAVAEMWARGDWLIPTVNGQVFAEKPILLYWLALAAAAVGGGVSELTLRVPSAMAGLASVLLVYALVLPVGGRSRARLAGVILLTSYLVFWSARSVQMDGLLAASVLGAITCAARAPDARRPLLLWALAGAAAGLGVLAKGPAGIVLPALILLLDGRLRSWRGVAVAAASCAAVVAPWIAALAWRDMLGTLRETMIRQNLGRVLAPWDHVRPPWYFALHLWPAFAPWSLVLPAAAALPARDEDERRLDRLGWITIAVVVGLFTLSPSKRNDYILPAAPGVALLVSGLAQRWREWRVGPRRRAAVLGICVALGGAGLATAVVLARRPLPAPELASPIGALALLLGGGGALLVAAAITRPSRWQAPRGQLAGLVLMGWMLSLCTLSAAWVLPSLDAVKSARPVSERIAALAGAGEVATYRFWEWRAEYAFYTGRRMPNLRSAEALRAWMSAPGRFVLVEGDRADEVAGVLGRRPPLVRERVGRQEVLLLGPAGATAPSGARPRRRRTAPRRRRPPPGPSAATGRRRARWRGAPAPRR